MSKVEALWPVREAAIIAFLGDAHLALAAAGVCLIYAQGMTTGLYIDPALDAYAFGEDHPFGPQRLPSFRAAAASRGLTDQCQCYPALAASPAQLGLFHGQSFVALVQARSESGSGYLDRGDTPAFAGVFEAAARVVGSVLDACDRVLAGEIHQAFLPMAGLHHARRDRAGGFCVFNDIGVAIHHLRQSHGLYRIAYVDIDAHHGDGVYYGFAEDPELWIGDIHEDGHFLYPGTGAATENGDGIAKGTKLNLPLPPMADDAAFFAAWERVESHLRQAQPQLILLQAGVDSLAGDPITHLRFSPAAHAHATTRLKQLAQEYAGGRLLVLGGGGYHLGNLAEGWCAVLEALLQDNAATPQRRG